MRRTHKMSCPVPLSWSVDALNPCAHYKTLARPVLHTVTTEKHK